MRFLRRLFGASALEDARRRNEALRAQLAQLTREHDRQVKAREGFEAALGRERRRAAAGTARDDRPAAVLGPAGGLQRWVYSRMKAWANPMKCPCRDHPSCRYR